MPFHITMSTVSNSAVCVPFHLQNCQRIDTKLLSKTITFTVLAGLGTDVVDITEVRDGPI